MVSTVQCTPFLRSLAIVAAVGCYSSTAFTSYPSCQFSTRRHQLIRDPSSISSGLCSQLSSSTRMRKISARPRDSSLGLFRRQHQGGAATHNIIINNNPLFRLHTPFQVQAWWTAILRVQLRLKRVSLILAACAVIWFGTAGSYATPALAASAGTTSISSSILERLLPAANDQIIDRYVKRHMFDDDDANLRDPLEAAYREAYEDYKTAGAHPRALKEITREVLGQSSGYKFLKSEEETGSLGIFGVLKAAIGLLERRGLSEATALVVVATSLVVAVPSSALAFALIVSGMSKRSMNKLMKKRYGDSYSLDATIREEPDVEAPDDDDDGDDDDDDDNDDE